ncbi:hypothetical protein GYMLUDRAFT_167917 [Collybiopsis luxurians FD-317 M1]|uniref:CDC20/Fizzy WD40 domain-containing protein n=1 Tax=Collybiopsis luxurians FD-317 M1 TaxID=944289 RepID=A0A0D0CWN1_9AGAR|nr:hypothetical protein GYMLUDRAFT_167917 [Collybiopsis luxurians FD-317 M1]
MSFLNSRFGKRLRASHEFYDENRSPKRKRRRIGDPPPSSAKSPTKSPSRRTSALNLARATTDVTNTPVRRRKAPRYNLESGDRFVLSLDRDSLRASYSLDDAPHTSPSRRKKLKVPSDPVTDQANDLYKSVLRTEFAGSPKASPSTSFATPLPARRSLSFGESNPFDTSPLSPETRLLMNQPRPRIRQVAKAAFKTLDAADLAEDFYTNLIDWAPSGLLAVGIGEQVFLWKGDSDVTKLCSVSTSKDEYSALSFMRTGPTIAVSTYGGNLDVYDAETLCLTRKYPNAHDGMRIGALSWTSYVLSSGSRDSTIRHWDIRDRDSRPIKQSVGHTQEVCGLKWSGDGGIQSSLLASGGNDNKLCIWDLRGVKRDTGFSWSGVSAAANEAPSVRSAGTFGEKTSGTCPLYKFRQHTAAVKGLAWDPHLPGVLASGGGKDDRHIRFWNTTTGTLINEINTQSQVCNLVWSTNSHELVSAQGYSTATAPYQVCIWQYPSMRLVTSLAGHSDCVQYLALSPEGDTIVTGSADQTVRFWNVFPSRVPKAKVRDSVLDFGKLIR